jgi:enoyl-CoA hydratase/carnithine racemase
MRYSNSSKREVAPEPARDTPLPAWSIQESNVSYQDILFDIEDGIATITLNRPQHSNAFSGKMGTELGQAYLRCDQDDDVRAVIVTGAGREFCVGADMGSGDATFQSQERAGFSAGAGIEPAAWEVRKPVIAAMNGHAVGIGLTIAMQCDIRLAAIEAKYGIVQVRRGVIPDCYSHWTVPRAVGFARATELFLTGRVFRGDEAAAIGIATRAFAAHRVLIEANAIARDIADNTAPLSVAISKRLLWETPALTREQTGLMETELHHHVMGRSDAIEGVMAYLERRPPQWKLSVVDDWPEWPGSDASG